jgi:hypothetical protein
VLAWLRAVKLSPSSGRKWMHTTKAGSERPEWFEMQFLLLGFAFQLDPDGGAISWEL